MANLGFIYFLVCAVFALLGALATVISRNPIRGAMGLLLMIVSIAGLYLSLHAQFLAAIQLIVYAGAIVVLFLFVIMLLGPDAESSGDKRGFLTRGVGAVLFSLVGAFVVAFVAGLARGAKLPPELDEGFGGIDALGKYLFTEVLVPFELSSALLIVAAIGAIAVAKGAIPKKSASALSSVSSKELS